MSDNTNETCTTCSGRGRITFLQGVGPLMICPTCHGKNTIMGGDITELDPHSGHFKVRLKPDNPHTKKYLAEEQQEEEEE